MMTTKQIDLQALQQSIEKTKITTNLNEDGDVDIYFEGKKVISFKKETGHCFLGDVDLNNFLENTSDILQNHYQALQLLAQKNEILATK